MAHLHTIYDSDLHFVIDPATRVITNQSENKNSVIQFDHNSERFTFELPRYIEEHDMLECNRVEVHYVNIDSKTGNQASGVYEVQDLQVSPHDEKVAICSWLVSSNATQYAGTLNFVIRFACTRGEVVDCVWNTAVFKNYAVQNGLYNSEPVVEQHADVLAEWYQSLFTASADGVVNIQEARAAAIMAVDAVADERIADIEQAGSDVIASLPEDYLEMLENMAPPIVETATGEAIAITDSANRKLRGLTLYGKSTQDGTPTPEAPVEIESVVEPTVRVCGKNMLKQTSKTVTTNGVTFTPNADGSITANGTSTDVVIYPINANFYGVKKGERYTISGNPKKTTDFMLYFDQKDKTNNKFAGALDYGEGGTIEIAENCAYLWVGIWSKAGVTFDNLTFFPMLRVASNTDDKYEQYREQVVRTTHTLPGIPVTSGGNYTDENGQQWVCDEVDFERGVYIKRLHQETFDGSEDERWKHATNYFYLIKEAMTFQSKASGVAVSTHFLRDVALSKFDTFRLGEAYGPMVKIERDVLTEEDLRAWLNANPVTILYEVATPIETALTPEELAAYASLRSNYPNTTVLNDGGAGMAVSYVADTKLYIDKKL